MPHIIIKIFPGKSEQQKVNLVDQMVESTIRVLKCSKDSISISIEEINRKDWNNQVYKQDILDKWNSLYKKPDYNPHT